LLFLLPLGLGIEPGSRENETEFKGLERHYTRIPAGNVFEEREEKPGHSAHPDGGASPRLKAVLGYNHC
jgi:hypothetical protein